MGKSGNQLRSRMLIWTLVITTLGVTPFYSYDPINVLRASTLLVFGSISLGVLITNFKILLSKEIRTVLILSVLFLLWIVFASVNSNMGITDILFGVTGRNTGLLTYLSLIILMVFAVIVKNNTSNLNLIFTLLFCGLISALYGLIQSFGLDPFEWISPYSPVFGFFGNPNFQASFMGISATAALAYCLQKNKWDLWRTIWLLYIPLSLCVVYLSKSQQGYLVFAAGASLVIYLWIKSSDKLSNLKPVYLIICFIGVISVLLDILQKSPWQSVLYKPSVTFRGDFWRAGWRITQDNPFFGVGLDGYRDSYRLYRDQITAQRNPTAMVDSAHNVFLDISSGGGFPLLIIYCGLILLVIFSIVRVVRREKGFNYSFAGIAGAWVAYLAQSVISINQIGLAVWGWVLSGVIIGYEIRTRNVEPNTDVIKPVMERAVVYLGVITGLVVSQPLVIADGQFRSTVKTGDVIKIEQNLENWPQSVIRMNVAAQIFIDGGFADRALVISQKAVKLNPRNFEAWEKIYLNPDADENSKKQALLMMRELDPFNPNIK
jgi:O-antigen ligase